jgi:hypothetical protein
MRPIAVLVAVLVLGFPSQSTASVPKTLDSPGVEVSAPDSASVSQPEPSTLKIGLERDSTLIAARVEPVSGFVLAIRADGTEEYVPNNRIRWIRDAQGRDRTAQVLDRGKSVGDLPISIRYRVDRRSSRSLRGSPLPMQKVFPVLQAGVLVRLDREHGAFPTKHPASLAFDLGAMKNVTRRWGAGGSLYFAGDEDFSRFGAKVRFRRWLGSAVAIDAAPGILIVEDPDRAGNQYLPGFVGELGVSFGDWVSVTGQMEAAVRQGPTGYYLPAGYGGYNPTRIGDRTEVSWYLGGKFGGEAALGATFGTLLVGIILLSGAGAVF